MPRVRVWDVPTRISHWSFVVLVGFSWWSAEAEWHLTHRLSGYTLLALLLFRLYWGFAGSDTARFGSFLRGRTAVLTYVDALFDRDQHPHAGHNPLGGWFSVLLLALLLAQCLLGLTAITLEGTHGGPLSRLLPFEVARDLATAHHRLFNAILLLVAVHVAAMAFYWTVKRQNLVAPMITGFKSLPAGSESPGGFRSGRTAGLVALAGLLIAVLLLEVHW